MKPEFFFAVIFGKKSYVKFHVSCMQTDGRGNVTVPFRNFANASEMICKTYVASSERHLLQV